MEEDQSGGEFLLTMSNCYYRFQYEFLVNVLDSVFIARVRKIQSAPFV